MKLNILLVSITFSALISCNGQEASNSFTGNPKISIGDTVSELSKSIWIVFQATNGDYWFGSDIDGVYCFDGKHCINYKEIDGLSSNRVRGIQEDKQGNIYISTLSAINKFDGTSISTLSAIPSHFAKDNWKLQDDDLWFSILGKNGDKGPYRYDGKNLYQLQFPKHYMADEYFKRFPNNAWSPYEVYCIYKDLKGNIWFGTSNFGACRYDGKSLSWLYEEHLTLTPNGGSFGIRSIIEDRNGKFWFCNTRYRFDISPDILNENENVFIKYEKEKGIEGIKSANKTDHIYFQSIIEDNKGDLWMATYNEGIWKYDGKEVRQYPMKDGNFDINVFSIFKDTEGELWLGTQESGAYKFNGKTFEKFRL